MRLVPRRSRSDDDRHLQAMIPNILTLLGLISGGTAIRFALESNWRAAIIAIIVAAAFDGLDGRLARALRVTSRFGAELDSLSDFLSFGLAPAMIIYFWSLQQAGSLGWAFVLLFTACCAIRLARFNVGQTLAEQNKKEPWMQKYFTGVPTPAAAGLILLPLIFFLQTGFTWAAHPVLTGGFLLATAFLMISRLPTFSVKSLKIPRPLVFLFFTAFVFFILLLIAKPWLTLLICGLLYLATIPLSYVLYQRQRAAALLLPDEDGIILTLPDEPSPPPEEEEREEEEEEEALKGK